MGRVDPAVRIGEALRDLPEQTVCALSDAAFPLWSENSSVRKAQDDSALHEAAGQNAYYVIRIIGTKQMRLFFFGDSEQQVLDRIQVAFVMLT